MVKTHKQILKQLKGARERAKNEVLIKAHKKARRAVKKILKSPN